MKEVQRISVWVAVLLLFTSGMSLPLASFASGATQLSNAAFARADFRNGHVVLDGVPSSLYVSQPYVVKPHSYFDVDGKALEARCDNLQIPGQAIPGWLSGECVRTKGVAFVNGFSQALGPAGGCYQKVGQGAAETTITSQSFSGVSSVTPSVPKLWWDFFQRRSKFEIYVEILEVIKRGPMTPFEIAFYARLNHKRTKEYVEFLVRNGYLQPVIEDGKTSYVLTREGMSFLDRARALFGDVKLIEVANYGYQRDF